MEMNNLGSIESITIERGLYERIRAEMHAMPRAGVSTLGLSQNISVMTMSGSVRIEHK